MSFDLYVLAPTVPHADLEELRAFIRDGWDDGSGELRAPLTEVVADLRARFPDEDADGWPWSGDGLGSQAAGGQLLVLLIRWPHVRSTAPIVIEVAAARGLRVYDPQNGRLYG